MRLEPATPEELAKVTVTIDRWAEDALKAGGTLVAVDRDEENRRWYLRMRGEDKAIITCWLTLKERTAYWEAQLMPAPEENVSDCYEYLLRRAAQMAGLSFAIGDEEAIYLMGHLPIEQVSDDELDRYLGSIWEWTETSFATAMSIGFRSQYRRPR